MAYGAGTRGVKPTGLAAAQKELDRNQKQRARRFVRDSIDRSLLDLASFYRDVVALQLGAQTELINEELRPRRRYHGARHYGRNVCPTA